MVKKFLNQNVGDIYLNLTRLGILIPLQIKRTPSIISKTSVNFHILQLQQYKVSLIKFDHKMRNLTYIVGKFSEHCFQISIRKMKPVQLSIKMLKSIVANN